MPVCGLDLSSWTLPDAEAHADGCPISRAPPTPRRGPGNAARES